MISLSHLLYHPQALPLCSTGNSFGNILCHLIIHTLTTNYLHKTESYIYFWGVDTSVHPEIVHHVLTQYSCSHVLYHPLYLHIHGNIDNLLTGHPWDK